MLEGCSQVGVEGQVRWSALWDPVRYMDFILGAVGSQRWVLNRGVSRGCPVENGLRQGTCGCEQSFSRPLQESRRLKR